MRTASERPIWPLTTPWASFFDKLEVESRAQAIVRSREAGFGKA